MSVRLVGNLQLERRGGSRGSRRFGGTNVPVSSRGTTIAILGDCSAAYEVIVLETLNVSNLRMISAGVPVEIRVCFTPPGSESDRA
jgi:hypothetical protein